MALLVLREVFAFLRSRSPDRNGNLLARQVADLWEWHNRSDEEGVKVWYVRKSLERSIHRLASNVEQQTQVLHDIESKITGPHSQD